ncbi:CHAP domain-containing protein [Phycicoccus flavus]|uniref:CHAP domain-containing protein n=1 Tax=Phycicoccus flavus TaxID=2502783 RepID=UPI000FEC1ADB|nr:CHAP domain-containing protein [Phycicoccus flavus]NHA67986.1 CHAP domain-containing protein [Phycicoccus flavus]
MTRRPALALVLAAAALAASTAVAAPATADPIPVGSNLSQLRQDTVKRASAALNNPRAFKLAGSDTIHKSTVYPARNKNVLELDGSNANRVVFNHYNGNSWCGSFIAAMWTGKTMPDASAYPRLPRSYESSQAWRTDAKVSTLWHPFTGAGQRLPRPGDVLVWSDDGSSWAGHVGLVVQIDTSSSPRTVTTVEGNVSGDEIRKLTYAWGSEGPKRTGKTFRGYTARD